MENMLPKVHHGNQQLLRSCLGHATALCACPCACACACACARLPSSSLNIFCFHFVLPATRLHLTIATFKLCFRSYLYMLGLLPTAHVVPIVVRS